MASRSDLQERYDEKWNLSVVPKMIEEELNCKADEENARKKLVEAAQREAGHALEAEGSRLQQVFSSLQERIQDAKSLAAAACKPMPLPEKVRPSCAACVAFTRRTAHGIVIGLRNVSA